MALSVIGIHIRAPKDSISELIARTGQVAAESGGGWTCIAYPVPADGLDAHSMARELSKACDVPVMYCNLFDEDALYIEFRFAGKSVGCIDIDTYPTTRGLNKVADLLGFSEAERKRLRKIVRCEDVMNATYMLSELFGAALTAIPEFDDSFIQPLSDKLYRKYIAELSQVPPIRRIRQELVQEFPGRLRYSAIGDPQCWIQMPTDSEDTVENTFPYELHDGQMVKGYAPRAPQPIMKKNIQALHVVPDGYSYTCCICHGTSSCVFVEYHHKTDASLPGYLFLVSDSSERFFENHDLEPIDLIFAAYVDSEYRVLGHDSAYAIVLLRLDETGRLLQRVTVVSSEQTNHDYRHTNILYANHSFFLKTTYLGACRLMQCDPFGHIIAEAIFDGANSTDMFLYGEYLIFIYSVRGLVKIRWYRPDGLQMLGESPALKRSVTPMIPEDAEHLPVKDTLYLSEYGGYVLKIDLLTGKFETSPKLPTRCLYSYSGNLPMDTQGRLYAQSMDSVYVLDAQLKLLGRFPNHHSSWLPRPGAEARLLLDADGCPYLLTNEGGEFSYDYVSHSRPPEGAVIRESPEGPMWALLTPSVIRLYKVHLPE